MLRGFLCRFFRHFPVSRHVAEIEEWLFVAFVDRVLDLFVELSAGFVRKSNLDVFRFLVRLRPLAILRERRFARVARCITLGEHLFQDAETIVLYQHIATRMSAQRFHVVDKSVEVVGVVSNVLTGVVAVLFDEIGDLRFLGAIDAFDQRDAEITVVDTQIFMLLFGSPGRASSMRLISVPPSTSM